MSLVAGAIARDALGRLRVVGTTGDPVPHFNGGTPADAAGLLVVGPYASGYFSQAYLNGIGYTAAGAIVTDALGAITAYAAGLPCTDNGLASEVNAVPVDFVAGIPVSATGRVCTAT